jgi:2-hydroxychromene-2-carboxylate isomerase
MPTMDGPICFFIDFVSTYSYFAALDIDHIRLCHGRYVVWSVVSLPHVFK